MPVYSYRSIDSTSQKTVNGKIEAETRRQAKELLREQGQIITQIEEERASLDVGEMLQQIPVLGPMLAPKVGMKDLSLFTQQLTVLIESGIPLIESLFMLEQQTTNPRLQEILKKIRADVIAGDSFSVALAKFPNDFSGLYINMIRSGEVSGDMDKITQRLAQLLEKFMALRNKVLGALTYPVVTIVIIVGVVGVIMYFVVPQFKNVFSSNGAELPLPTQMLIDTSNFLVNYWYALLFALIGFGVWFNMFRTTFGKLIVDQWILTIPVLGDVMRKVYTARFIRTLATVIASGVPLTEALSISSATVENTVIREAFVTARDSLLMGGTLARPLEQTGVFPIMVTKMIAIGEETGEMEKMLNKSADFLETEVDHGIETLTTLIEPLMIVVLGAILLGVALALYIPLFDMGKVVGGG